MKTFTVNGMDFSSYVQPKKYTVNQTDKYGNTAWTDANYVKHKSFVRTEVSGSFNLLFSTEQEYTSFINEVNNSKVAGYNTITLYVNNINEVKTINAYLTITANVAHKTEQYGGGFGVASVNVKVEER